MSDEKESYPSQNNIRGLIQDVSERFDAMSNELRKGTEFADTRPADAKTFMLISRHPRGLTELAKALKISRQATHRSVQRLVEAGVVQFTYAEGSKRDMIAQVTKKGLQARKVGIAIAKQIESDVVARVGKDDLEALRHILVKLC